MALRGISSSKLRSALTVLGVLIGVAAVIILVAFGTGSSRAVESRIEQLGTNTLTVINTGRFGRGRAVTGTQTQQANLTIADVNAIDDPANAPDVQSVSPVLSTSVTSTYEGATYTTSVDRLDSVVPDLGRLHGRLGPGDHVDRGRADTTGWWTSARTSRTTSSLPGPTRSARSSSSGSSNFEVIGVLAPKGTSGLTNEDAVAIAPYTAVQDELTGESQSFSELLVQGKSSSTLEPRRVRGREHPRRTERHDRGGPAVHGRERGDPAVDRRVDHEHPHLPARDRGGHLASRRWDRGHEHHARDRQRADPRDRHPKGDRRAEVGDPRSVPHRGGLISLIGGAVGVGVGLIGSRFRIDGVQPVVASYSIPLAFGVALAVGIFFGFYPANRAASLRPIDALRHE